MKTVKGIKTVRRVDTSSKVFNDYGKLVNPVNLYVITKLEDSRSGKGFAVTFRTYSETFENGGFETTLWFQNASIKNVDELVGTPSYAKQVASTIAAELTSYKTNNRKK